MLVVATTAEVPKVSLGAGYFSAVILLKGCWRSLFPYVVIDRLTIWQAAAHPSALAFVLAGALVVLPFIVGYTIYSYRVFRGKVRRGPYE